jgi:hypothetical protein
VVTLNLTLTKLDSTLVVMNATIHANASGATYLWINCDNNDVLTNSMSRDFNATSSGNYAAIIEQGDCAVTTRCVNLTITALVERSDRTFQVYPNPTTSDVTLQVSEPLMNSNVYLLDGLGREISKTVLEGRVSLRVSVPPSSGMYFLKIISASGESHLVKVIRE